MISFTSGSSHSVILPFDLGFLKKPVSFEYICIRDQQPRVSLVYLRNDLKCAATGCSRAQQLVLFRYSSLYSALCLRGSALIQLLSSILPVVLSVRLVAIFCKFPTDPVTVVVFALMLVPVIFIQLNMLSCVLVMCLFHAFSFACLCCFPLPDDSLLPPESLLHGRQQHTDFRNSPEFVGGLFGL